MAKRFIGGDTSVAPAGSIQAFAGANVPHGWLLCDGEVYDISQFPALAAALDGTWDSFAHPVDGTPSVGAGQFAVPNMKGLYLSGAGNAGGEARGLGVYQADKTAKNGLTGTFASSGHSHAAGTYSALVAVTEAGNAQAQTRTVTSWTGSKAIDSVARSNFSSTQGAIVVGSSSGNTSTASIGSTDVETRPKTAPVNYIIKY